jgi:hypothetical protein
MAAPTLEQVMLGLETRLATIAGLNTSPITPDQVTTPQAIVGVPDIPTYHATMARGKMDFEFTVTVFTSLMLDRDGQLKLASYANPTGASSVVAAIEADKTLGGVVDDCHVVSFRTLGREEVGQVGYYGGVFTVNVMATGS